MLSRRSRDTVGLNVDLRTVRPYCMEELAAAFDINFLRVGYGFAF